MGGELLVPGGVQAGDRCTVIAETAEVPISAPIQIPTVAFQTQPSAISGEHVVLSASWLSTVG